MKKYKALIFFLAGNLGIFISVRGQDTAAIRLIGSAHEDSIVLRWAPSTPLALKLLNEYGYRLERYTVVRDSAVLVNKPLKVIANSIKPAAPVHWQKYLTNDYVAIAAQAIYGEDFEVSRKGQNNIAEIVQESRELEMRYSFVLLAADVSPEAAQLSGMRFIDTDVKKNEKYLYRVYSLVPEDILKIEFGYTFLGPDEVKVLPAPPAPEIRRMEKAVMLRWNTYTTRDIYTGYFVEKSIDRGRTFNRITNLPVINTTTQETMEDENSFSVKTDSISGDTELIQYVIRGITAFGETGPPSSPAVITDEKPLTVTPAIIHAYAVDNSKVEIKWSFSEGYQSEIKGFRIERRTKLDEKYEAVDAGVQPDVRSYTDNSPYGTNYYRVVAFTPKGQRAESFPYMVQLEDSIPPVAPKNLKGTIDSTGTIIIQWDKNTEHDLIGYRVYRSNFKNAEFGQVTASPVEETLFYDTVNIKTLTKKVWYKIAAVDNRFNTSAFSELLELTLPDIIPPVPPVIRAIRAKEGGVEIQWIPSSSEDVEIHQIYRKQPYSASWELVKEYTRGDSCCYFLDVVSAPHRYQYSFIAIDDHGLKSIMTKPVLGSPLPVSSHDQVKDIRAIVDRDKKVVSLTWNYKVVPEKFLIYRSVNGEPLALYKTVKGSAKEFSDVNLRMNSNYEYRIKAVFKDGSESFFSDKVNVSY